MLPISNVALSTAIPAPRASAPIDARHEPVAESGETGRQSEELPTGTAAGAVTPRTADALLALGSFTADELVAAYLRDALGAYAAGGQV